MNSELSNSVTWRGLGRAGRVAASQKTYYAPEGKAIIENDAGH